MAIYQNEYNFRICIFDNCIPLADRIRKTEGLSFEIIPYSLSSLITQLSETTISIISYGPNKFHSSSTNFKELFSLANNVPVISIKSNNNTELIDAIYLTFKDGMNATFDERSILPKLNPSIYYSPISERFSLSAVSHLFLNILKSLLCTKRINSKTIEITSSATNKSSANTSTLNHSGKNLAIIADDIPASKLAEVFATWSNYFKFSRIKFVHLSAPSLEHIDLYIKIKIIPYLTNPGKLEDCYPLFVEDQYILYIDRDLQCNFIQGLEEYQKQHLLPNDFITRVTLNVLDKFLSSYSLEKLNDSLGNDSLTSDISTDTSCSGTDILDLLIIVPIQNKGWILDGIAKEIGSHSNLKYLIYYSEKNPQILPKAKNILFMHQSLLRKYFHNSLLEIEASNISCWYTHSSGEDEVIVEDYVRIFNTIHKVVFTCSANQALWIKRGVKSSKTVMILGGYDSDIFLPHKRHSEQYIGLCSSYYERKNPLLLFDIVKSMPEHQFLLIGRNWEQFSLFEYLKQCGNLNYKQISYQEYPYYYSKMDVFLSTSYLEGGPIQFWKQWHVIVIQSFLRRVSRLI